MLFEFHVRNVQNILFCRPRGDFIELKSKAGGNCLQSSPHGRVISICSLAGEPVSLQFFSKWGRPSKSRPTAACFTDAG